MGEPISYKSGAAVELARIDGDGTLVHIDWPAIERLSECGGADGNAAKLLLAVRQQQTRG